MTKDELQAIVNERAQACAEKYRRKIRRLHISQIDYYLDTIQHERQPTFSTETTTIDYTNREYPDQILSISVV